VIDVTVTGKAIPRLSRGEVAQWVADCVKAVERTRAARFKADEASVVFVDDATMKKLNRQYRSRNSTTDVLTFEADHDPAPDSARQLGEIVISVEQARRQAAAERHSLATEIRYLLLHGVLHAYGYDHDQDEGEMNALEVKLRAKLALD
jgi:probable rRNA maturation factor